MIWVLVVLQVISVACAVHLWVRGRGSRLRKALWSPVVLVPLLGPLVYGSVYEVPSPQPPGLQGNDSIGASSDHAGIGS